MKKNDLPKGLFAALLLASPWAGAGSPYPAPFEPKVLYQDAELIEKHSQSKAPVSTEQSPSKAQTQYPAAFEPEVLYRDAELIAKHAAGPRPLTTTAASPERARPAAAATKAENPLMENYPVGLIVLGLAGFVFWNMKRPGAEVQEIQREATVVVGGTAAETGTAGETGVAKYLKSLPAAPKATGGETGVAKYLKSLPVPAVVTAAETGVAKYLKSIPEAPKATGGETGVAKYLKTLGA